MPIPDLADSDVLRAALAPLELSPVGRVETIGDEYGFASSRVKVLVGGADGERTVVVKGWDVASHGVAEITFYEHWAPGLPARLADCYGAHSDDHIGVLVLEDLPVARQGDAAVPFPAADARAIALDVASIHVATRGAGTDRPPPRPAREADWHASRRAAHLERHGRPRDRVLAGIIERAERADALATDILKNVTPGLIHGDLHADNVVFLADGTPVLLDWARPLWGPVADPLASLLLGTEPAGHDGAVEALRSKVPVGDDEIHAAMLRRLVTATLGTAIWQPQTERQRRLVDAGLAQAEVAAAWLGGVAPGLVAALGR